MTTDIIKIIFQHIIP